MSVLASCRGRGRLSISRWNRPSSRAEYPQQFLGGAEQVLPWLISGSGGPAEAGTGGWPEVSAGCAGGGAGGAECVPQASEVN